MSYYELVEIIKGIASSHKLVEEVDEGDIYENLNSGVHRYGHVNITTNNISFDEDQLDITMNIFYTDRLQVDTDKNKLQVQSIALMVLYEIMSKLKNGDYDIYVGDTTAQVFEEKFSDICAGAYMTITLSTPIPYVCDEESFEE